MHVVATTHVLFHEGDAKSIYVVVSKNIVKRRLVTFTSEYEFGFKMFNFKLF